MWLAYALGAAVFNAAYGLEQKRISKKSSIMVLASFTRIWSLPLLLISFLLLHGSWHVASGYWRYLFICSTLTVVATFFTFTAYRLVDFSLAFPVFNFTPAIALLAAWVVDGTKPSIAGIAGVGLMVLGSFWLTKSSNEKLLGAFKKLSHNAGMLMAVGAAAIYAFTTSFDKLGVAASSPVTWSLGLNLAMSIIMLPFLFFIPQRAINKKKVSRFSKAPLIASIFVVPLMLLQMYSLQSGGYVPYILAIKQLSVIVAVLASYELLKERPSRSRWFGTIVMTMGAIIIGVK